MEDGTDVRNLGGRIAIGIASIVCGVASAFAASMIADWLVRHPSPHTAGGSSGQREFFGMASIVFGFIVGGAIGGIAIESIRRRMHRRRLHRALPRMAVHRSRPIG